MSAIKVDINTLLIRCKCCLEEGDLRDMWAEYICNGSVEVYGAMLKECFQFPWVHPTGELDQICGNCIEQLRSTLTFRRNIAAAKEVLDQLLQEHGITNEQDHTYIKIDVLNKKVDQEIDNKEEYEMENLQSEMIIKEEVYEVTKFEKTNDTTKSEDVEYLSGIEEGVYDAEQMQVEYLEDDSEVQSPVPGSRKRKRGARFKTYKKYTRDELEEAIDMVMSKNLTKCEAAEKYSIPIKTLSYKLRAREAQTEDDEKKNVGEDSQKKFQLVEEIKTILTYTNASPFKFKIGKLYCAYCTTDGPRFESPDDLRTHTRTKHAKERIKNVEIFMRPFYLNYIVKLDIENLHCTVCTTQIQSWNDMFGHLKEKHEIDLDLAYTRAIPYILSEDISCCLCEDKFPHFHVLDFHMNKHYNNFICGECGDTFITESRLKKHEETHSLQKFPCKKCGKVFSLEKYRKKHYDNVHLRELKYRCNYCPETFLQDYSRHLHVIKEHEGKVKKINCEYCDMSFTWRPYYLKHVKFNHIVKEKQFKCKLCPKSFLQKYELKNHEEWHAGKGYTCYICGKKFSSKPYLQKHFESKHPDCENSKIIVLVDSEDVEEIIGQ